MKKLMIISFALALLMSAVAVAQYGAQPPDNSKSGTSMKTVSITGKISADGTTFVSDTRSTQATFNVGLVRIAASVGSLRQPQRNQQARYNHQ
jgi:hypothetical protein